MYSLEPEENLNTKPKSNITMSVTTTFDEKKDAAKEALAVAIKNIRECLDEDTWGYRDIKSSYIDELAEVHCQLMKLKRKI